MLGGRYAKGGLAQDDDIYVAMNMRWEDKVFHLPKPTEGKSWYIFANTGDNNNTVYDLGTEPPLPGQNRLPPRSHSVVILVAK